jgi:hypothetical protein
MTATLDAMKAAQTYAIDKPTRRWRLRTWPVDLPFHHLRFLPHLNRAASSPV